MYDPPEELLERLRSPHVTPQDVFEFLNGQYDALYDPQTGPEPPSPSEFFKGQDDLDTYWRAYAWWPKVEGLPPQLACPTIWQLCFAYHDQDPRVGATFAERLTLKSMPVVNWIEANGLSVQNPNETPEERKARLNREAVQRHRMRNGKAGTPEEQERERAVKAAYDHWQALAAKRTSTLADLDQRVRDAQEAFYAVCDERKRVRAELDAEVQSAREAYQAVKKSPPA